MGSHNFFDQAPVGLVDLEDAYRHCVEEAVWDHGHDAYNGTISTTHGVREFKDFPVSNDDDLNRAEGLILERTRKWEYCEGVWFEGRWNFIGWAAS